MRLDYRIRMSRRKEYLPREGTEGLMIEIT